MVLTWATTGAACRRCPRSDLVYDGVDAPSGTLLLCGRTTVYPQPSDTTSLMQKRLAPKVMVQ